MLCDIKSISSNNANRQSKKEEKKKKKEKISYIFRNERTKFRMLYITAPTSESRCSVTGW